MYRKPSTHRGIKTRELLIRHAAEVFTNKGFHNTSVAGICRTAGVANGSFYQYFKTKHDVFSAIVETAQHALAEAIEGHKSPDKLCHAIFDYFEEFGSLFQVFREAEFIEAPDFAQKFYQPIVLKVSESLHIDSAQAWSFIGALTFVALHYGVWRRKAVDKKTRMAFLDVANNGISPHETDMWRKLDWPKQLTQSETPLPTKKAEKTRRALLSSARRLFADKGYGKTKIAEITMEAEVALGTYYVHFPSKRDILRELVSDIRDTFEAHTRSVADETADRLELERRYLIVFLSALASNRDIYRIVREAEFAEPAVGRGYYEEIARRYSENLKAPQDKGELRQGNRDVMAWAIMGTAHTAGMRWVLWEDGKEAPETAVRSTLRWLFTGITGCQQ